MSNWINKNKYPDLNVLSEKARVCLDKVAGCSITSPEDFEITVFSQTWGSTALGFDEMVGGCAMTDAFTSVFYSKAQDIYVVFFGNEPCYLVSEANEAFREDLKKRCLASYSKAKEKY